MKRKRVEAWAVVSERFGVGVACTDRQTAEVERNLDAEALPGDEFKVVHLVPFNPDAERVVRAAVKMTKRDKAEGWTGDDVEDNPEHIALWAAVEQYQRKGRKP